jgi:adenylate cyclase
LAVWRLSAEVRHAPAKVTEQAVSLSQLLWRASQTWSANTDQAELQLEMGLETGSALVGSMGPGERRFHAVLGEPVVVAQALREMAAELAYPFLLGPNLAQVLKLSENSVLSTDRENTDAMSKSDPIQTLDSISTLRLGEFLLPGTAEARVVFASLMDMDDQRLRLVDTQAQEQRAA